MTMQLARIETRSVGRVVVAAVAGEIDMSNAADLRSAVVAPLTNESTALIIDLTGVTYLDSAAIHLVYELREQLGGRGLELRLVLPPTALTLDALRIAGVPDVVPVFATADEALADVA
jgi:anti-sigma B factor antagonist